MLNTVILLLIFVLRGCICDQVVTVDLSYEVNERSTHWFGTEPFSRKAHHNGYHEKGFWYESYSVCMSEHLSTHLDAPSHFAHGKWSVADIPLEHLIYAKGVVVDIREKVKANSSAEMTAEDLMAWMDKHGPLPDGAVVFVLTGWGSNYGNHSAYYGTLTNDTTKLAFPGINVGAAQLLTGYEKASGRRVFGMGLDTPSLDHGPSNAYPTHVELAKANMFGLENVANLQKLPPRGFDVIVMPMKVTGGSGIPTRVVARITQGTGAAVAFNRPSWQHFLLVFITFTAIKLLQ